MKRIVSGMLVAINAVALTFGASAAALPTQTAANGTDTPATQTQIQRLARLKTRADAEIARRLTQLNKLDTLIANTKKLSATDKTSLTSEVNSAVSDLTALKAKIDADTDLATALTDKQSIVTEYRVYVLVTPKVHIVSTADAQQTAESKLTTLAGKLQTRLTNAKNQGKNVTALQTQLDGMTQKIAAAKTLSASVEQAVLALGPSDYNTNHGVLGGFRTQLTTAHADNTAAYNDARAIVQGLKSL